MNEREPEPKPFYLEHNGIKYECRPDNTAASIHAHEFNLYDCILHIHNTEDGETHIIPVFREQMGAFDAVINIMRNRGYQVYPTDEPTDYDKELYFDTFGRDPYHNPNHIEEKSTLTPRQERIIHYLSYLLEHDHITPNDFKGDGEMFI